MAGKSSFLQSVDMLDLQKFCQQYAQQFDGTEPIVLAEWLVQSALRGDLEPCRLVYPKNRHDPTSWVNVAPEQVRATLEHVTAQHWLKLPNGAAIPLQGPEPGEGYLDWFGHFLVSRELAAAFADVHRLPLAAWWQTPTPEIPQPAATKPAGSGGRPPKYPWDEVGAAFGAWLHERPSRPQLRFKEYYDAVVDLLSQLGYDEVPDNETVRPYVRRWLKAYRATLGKPEK